MSTKDKRLTKDINAGVKKYAANPKQRINSFLANPLKVFVTLSLMFGFASLFTMPAFMVPDETVHFYRAYQVGEGHFVSELKNGKIGGHVPFVINQGVVSNSRIPPLSEERLTKEIRAPDSFVAFPSASLYSPVLYAPQAAGIDIGKLFHKSFASMVSAGRIMNLLVYTALIGLAIGIARQGRWVYAVTGLLPVSIQQAASLSADVMTLGLAFVTIAFIHSLFLQKKKIQTRQYIGLGVLALGLGLTKQTNLILLLPLLLLPVSLFKNRIHKFLIIGCIFASALFTTIGWYYTVNSTYSTINVAAELNMPGVNQEEQLKYLTEHPQTFVKVLFRTYIFEGYGGTSVPTSDFFVVSTVGYFSWLSYKLPLAFVVLSYIVMFIALLYRARPLDKTNIRSAALSQTATFLLSVLGITIAVYLVWTPVGGSQVAGIQGRYFIPLIPLLIPLSTLIKKYISICLDEPYRMGQIVVALSVINFSMMLFLTAKWFQ